MPSFSLEAGGDPRETLLWAEAVAAEAGEGFGEEGQEKQQTAVPAEETEGEPGLEH